MKTFDQLEKEDAPNIHKMLSSHERKLRSILLNKILQSNGSVPLSEIRSQADDAAIDVSPTLASLKEKGLIALQDDGSVTDLYPFSAVPTRHKVQLKDGRSFFAMCAIDSLGIAYELEEDTVISSSCSQCNADISIELKNGEIFLLKPATSRALHVALGDYKDWANTC
jgi:hypothetical protein